MRRSRGRTRRARQPALPVIAFLWNGAAPAGPGGGPIRVVADALRDFGQVEGRDYRVETRYAAGDASRLPALAAELLAIHPAVVLLGGHVAARAVQDLSRTTPIVIMGMNDPVAAGLVASRAHPGGNITGVSNMSEETQTKLVEILHEMLPDLRRITAVANPQNLSLRPMLDALRQQAAALGIAVDAVEVAAPADLDPAFAALSRRGAAAVEDPQGRQPCRPARRTTDAVSPARQHEDGQGARPHHTAFDHRPRRRGDRMRRREFIGLVGGAVALPLAARAQQPAVASKRLAIFSPSEPSALMNEHSDNRYYRALFAELRRLGHVEGQNLVVERYGRERNASGPAALAAEVVRNSPDVVYVVGPGAPFFKRETDKIPIVALTGDPIAAGLVQNLAHPGGNITGVSVDTGPSIHGKRIALLREMFPAMSKLSCLTLRIQWEGFQGPATRAAADAAGIPVVTSLIELPSTEAAYRDAVAQASRDGANAIMVGDNPDTMANRALITNLIGAAGIPAMYALPEFVDAGGLIAYSFDLVELNKRVANDIDAILRGANPGDIPYYQASKFELSLNLKTAKALGLAVLASLLASADKVIE